MKLWKTICTAEIDLHNSELHLGDIIVIIDRNTRNYLKIGSVIEVNIVSLQEQIKKVKQMYPYYTRSQAIEFLQVQNSYTDKYTYVVEFVVTKFSNCGEYSSCQDRIIKEYYDETLPQKCAIIYREEE